MLKLVLVLGIFFASLVDFCNHLYWYNQASKTTPIKRISRVPWLPVCECHWSDIPPKNIWWQWDSDDCLLVMTSNFKYRKPILEHHGYLSTGFQSLFRVVFLKTSYVLKDHEYAEGRQQSQFTIEYEGFERKIVLWLFTENSYV